MRAVSRFRLWRIRKFEMERLYDDVERTNRRTLLVVDLERFFAAGNERIDLLACIFLSSITPSKYAHSEGLEPNSTENWTHSHPPKKVIRPIEKTRLGVESWRVFHHAPRENSRASSLHRQPSAERE